MSGLILKDFLILRKTLRSYLLFVAVYSAVASSGFWSASFMGGFIIMMLAILPMNVFAYDKQAKWDTYGLALPVSRTKTVAARYLTVLVLTAVSVALSAALGAALSLLGRMEETFAEYLLTCTVMAVLALLTNAMMLPLLYKFGSERARMMLFGVMGTIVLVGVVVLAPLGGIELLKSLELAEPAMEQVAAVPVIAAAAGLVLLALSFLLSRHFYGSKDI